MTEFNNLQNRIDEMRLNTNTIMLFAFCFFFLQTAFCAAGTINLRDENVSVGYPFQLDCTGSGITCTKSGGRGIITVAGTAADLGAVAPDYLTLSATSALTSERVFTVGAGLSGTDAGAGSTYTLNATVTPSSTNTLTNKTIDGDDNTVQDLPYSAIKSTSRTGSDVKVVTGTAGSSGHCAEWNADGDLVTAGAACGTGGGGGGSLTVQNGTTDVNTAVGTIRALGGSNLQFTDVSGGIVSLAVTDNITVSGFITAASTITGGSFVSTGTASTVFNNAKNSTNDVIIHGDTIDAIFTADVSANSITLDGTFIPPTSTSLATPCVNNAIAVDSDATSGRRIYACESNVWVLQGDGTAASGSGTLTVQEEGSDVTTGTTTINFVGSSVTVTDSSGIATVTVSASGGGQTNRTLDIYSAKLSGTFVVQTPTGGDASTQGASLDAGDGNWRLLFDATTDEAAVWQFIMPDNYASAPKLNVHYSMNAATSGKVKFECGIMCVTSGDSVDIGTASFATLGTTMGSVPGTAGFSAELSCTFTDDSCASGDNVWVYLSTDANDTVDDTATGDREVINAEFNYTGN